ncbi:creatininase family protein, partial [candidate division KSB1 bacterium]
ICVIAVISLSAVHVFSQSRVSELDYPYMQNYCWMRLAEIVPEVTDRVILPIGTVEAHGALALGADNFIPVNIAGEIWDRCNALIAPPINHGYTGASISQFPGSITVRPEVLEEYIYDVLKDLVRSGFRNVLIINGHGGNTEPANSAMTRLHHETAAHFMVVNWWEMGWNVVNEVYGMKAQQSGHGDLEEAALVISRDAGLLDREMVDRLGRENISKERVGQGITLLPAWSTSMLPESGAGYYDFDVSKAQEYTRRKAELIADIFLEAVERWEMMESWK